jgi:thioesterase domain-containing protein/acyl carrier protein
VLLDVAQLRRDLARRLPEPMVPGEWLVLDSLPLTMHGKVDHRRLASLPLEVAWSPQTGRHERPQDDVAPRTLLELEIARIWQRLFGRDHVGRDDDFFELGGHSLMAAQLAVELERLLGHPVPIATLFRAQTVKALARTLADESWLPAWTSLVPLRPTGSRIPLFVVHGKGGDVFTYFRLARLLSDEQPVYGVRAVDLDGRWPPHGTVEEMSRHYAREIRALQPRGPYRLCGYSAGGWLAYAVATELRSQGQDVAVVILDTYPLCGLPWPARGEQILTRCLAAISGLQHNVREMSAMRVREWPQYAVARGREVVRRMVTLLPRPWRRGLAVAQAEPSDTDVSDRYVRVIARYSARSIQGRIELFLARAPLVPSLLARSQARLWRLLVRGPVNVHRLPCEHLEMFSAENLPRLAALLDTFLAAGPRMEPTVGGRSESVYRD